MDDDGRDQRYDGQCDSVDYVRYTIGPRFDRWHRRWRVVD